MLVVSLPLFSQETTEVVRIEDAVEVVAESKTKIKETDNILYEKKFQKNFQKKYESSEFDYSLTKPKESLWQKIKRKIAEFLSEVFKDIKINKINTSLNSILNILAFLVVFGGVFFLFRFLFGKEGNWFFSKKNKNINLQSRNIDENIHELNFSELIANFEKQQDFRSAIRYHFLHVLKLLTDARKIEWNSEKTNKEYLKELKKDILYNEFKTLVYVFDNVWYGEFLVSSEMYNTIKQSFIKAKQRIK